MAKWMVLDVEIYWLLSEDRGWARDVTLIRGVTRVSRPPRTLVTPDVLNSLSLPPQASIELLLPVIHDCQCPAGGRGEWLEVRVPSRECQ